MPIRPIDLQTLLMQMSQVGRDQAVEKDGPALQNAIQIANEQKKAVETREAVHRAEDTPDGAGAVKERQGRGRGARQGQGGPEDSEAEAEAQDEVVRDPSLGNRVDLSG
jgi:hypothetical protein